MGFRRGSCAEYLLWRGRVGLGATYRKSGCSAGLRDFSIGTGASYLLNQVATFRSGRRASCGVIELSEMFEGGLGERRTVAGDAQDESGALVVSSVLGGLRVILLDVCGVPDLL